MATPDLLLKTSKKHENSKFEVLSWNTTALLEGKREQSRAKEGGEAQSKMNFRALSFLCVWRGVCA